MVCVTYDSAAGKCSHNRQQIKQLYNEGKVVIFHPNDGKTYYLSDHRDARFMHFLMDESGLTIYTAQIDNEGSYFTIIYEMSLNVLQYEYPQYLTQQQKEQVRKNIGAAADGAVIKTVNGVAPDEQGNVQIQAGGAGAIPAFDLMAMGMPPASFEEEMDWVEADVAALCSALDSGPVKLKFTIGMGEDQLPVWITAQAMCIPDASIYLVSSQVHMEGAMLMLSLEIDKTANRFRMVLSVLGA